MKKILFAAMGAAVVYLSRGRCAQTGIPPGRRVGILGQRNIFEL
jgi:hypothetical protein